MIVHYATTVLMVCLLGYLVFSILYVQLYIQLILYDL